MSSVLDAIRASASDNDLLHNEVFSRVSASFEEVSQTLLSTGTVLFTRVLYRKCTFYSISCSAFKNRAPTFN